jgi:hypothetical protein
LERTTDDAELKENTALAEEAKTRRIGVLNACLQEEKSLEDIRNHQRNGSAQTRRDKLGTGKAGRAFS